MIVLIGYSAMAGTVGGGGLGSVAVQYGYQRFETGVMVATVVALIVVVTAVQLVGDAVVRLLTARGGGGGADGGAGRRLARLGRGRTAAAVAAAVVVPLALIGYGLGRGGEDEQTLRIAASPTPHAEILEYVEKHLAEKEGLKLDIRRFNDYVVPNTATESGESTPTSSSTSPTSTTSTRSSTPTSGRSSTSSWSRWASTPGRRRASGASDPATPLRSPTTAPTRAAPCTCWTSTGSSG